MTRVCSLLMTEKKMFTQKTFVIVRLARDLQKHFIEVAYVHFDYMQCLKLFSVKISSNLELVYVDLKAFWA